MRTEGLEEGPQTPKISTDNIQPEINWQEIPSDEDDDGSVDWSNISLSDIPSDEDDDGTVDYDAIDEKEVDVETFDFKERENRKEIIVIKDSDKQSAIGNLKNIIGLELKSAVSRYFGKVLPITNAEGVNKSDTIELDMFDVSSSMAAVMEEIKLQEGPDGSSYVDIKAVNQKIYNLYYELNISYRSIAIKNGYKYSGIYRRPAENVGRMFGAGYEYLSQEEETASTNKTKTSLPQQLTGKDTDFFDLVSLMKSKGDVRSKKLKGYRAHSHADEYERLLKDEDMRSSLGAMIAEQFRIKGSKSKTDISKYFVVSPESKNVLDDSSRPGTDLMSFLSEWSMKIFAAKSVGLFKPEAQNIYFINDKKDTIIQLPLDSTGKSVSPSVKIEYIQAAAEAVDRSVRPDKSSIVRKINFMDTSDYPGTVGGGELAHANFATLQINVFMDKISDQFEAYNNAPAERKDEMLKQFASPKVWDSMENMYKYTVAHELGHIMAAVIWDHKELNSNFQKSGPPTWRFRSGIKDMQKEINPLKQLEPISKYGSESTDEYWAEAYAKWLFEDEASDSFKKILDDYGLIRGKARRWVTDDTSSNPAGRKTLPDSAQDSFTYLNSVPSVTVGSSSSEEVLKKMVERIPYVGEYGEESAKEALKMLDKKYGATYQKVDVDNKELWQSIGDFLQNINQQWNGSSNYNSALASMYAIREEFNITNALPLTGRASSGQAFEERKKNIEEIDSFFKAHPEVFTFFKELLRANYEYTQEVLQKAGVTDILLYRGWNSAGDIKDKVVVPSRPLNSFSVKEEIARNFLGSGGSLTAVLVPAKDIFTFWKLFRGGHEGESEVILMGGAREMYSYAWNEWPKIEELVGTGKEVLID